MSAPGDDDPATTVRATDLMALGALAARLAHTAPDLARRPGTTATRPRGQGHEIREIRPFTEGDDGQARWRSFQRRPCRNRPRRIAGSPRPRSTQ